MNEEIKELRNELNDYARLKLNLAWLKSLKVSSKVWSELVTTGVLLLILVIALAFASIALSFYFAHLIGNSVAAFGIVSGIWLFIVLFMFLFRKGLLVRPLRNVFLRIISQNMNLYITAEDEDKE
jgi:hypothetical protein